MVCRKKWSGQCSRTARPRPHFVTWEHSRNVKVQENHPQRHLQRETALGYKIHILIIITVRRNVLAHFWHVHFLIWEVGWPETPSET